MARLVGAATPSESRSRPGVALRRSPAASAVSTMRLDVPGARTRAVAPAATRASSAATASAAATASRPPTGPIVSPGNTYDHATISPARAHIVRMAWRPELVVDAPL